MENAVRALGKAVVDLWGDLPPEIQERIFEAAVCSEADTR